MMRTSTLSPKVRPRRGAFRSIATLLTAVMVALAGSAALAQEGPFYHLALEQVADDFT